MILLSRDELIELSKVSIKDVNVNDLKELTDIHINTELSIQERAEIFFKEIKNPYLFKVNGTIVKVSYNNHKNKKLDDCLMQYLVNKRNFDNSNL